MDHLTLRAAFAAVLLPLALAACGGGSNSSTSTNTAPPSSSDGTTVIVTGVATPSTVSVVTAKNAN